MQRNTATRAAHSSYPSLSLRLCLRKAKAMVESMPDPDNYLPQESLAALAGYEGFKRNSAPKGFLATLNHFGLLEKDPQTRYLRFSDAVRSAVRAGREGKAELVAEAVVRPAFYQFLFRQFRHAPTRAAVEQRLMADGMAARPARQVAGAFLQDWAMAESLGVAPGALLPVAANNPDGPAAGPVREDLGLPGGARLKLVFAAEPTPADWKFLRDYAALKAA